MMRSYVIVAAAVIIGFVSMLVYRVSASDGLGLGQLPTPEHVAAAQDETPPYTVEFIVQQCDVAGPEAIEVAALPDSLDVPPADGTPKASFAAANVTDRSVAAKGMSEVVLEDRMAVRQGEFIMLSPSILYIP